MSGRTSIKCEYYENDKINVRFTFEAFPDVVFKPKHFKSHAYKYSYDDALSWANQSAQSWSKTGIFLTAYVKSLWGGMPDSQRNTIFPKVHLMWTETNGTVDDSVPSWINESAGYLPLIKQYKYSNGIGHCWFLGSKEDVEKYFDIVDDKYPESPTMKGETGGLTLHLVCPHCGEQIF